MSAISNESGLEARPPARSADGMLDSINKRDTEYRLNDVLNDRHFELKLEA